MLGSSIGQDSALSRHKEEVKQIVDETLETEGRSYKNIIRYMVDDGLFKYLPKGVDSWTYFLKPFMKLTRKEKTKSKTKN